MLDSMPPHFLIEPNLPDTFSRGELEDLGHDLDTIDSTFEARVAFSGDQVGAGPEVLEIVNVWIPIEQWIEVYVQSGEARATAKRIVEGIIEGLVIAKVINWMQERPKPPPMPPHNTPPGIEPQQGPHRITNLYGPNGRIIKTVLIKYPYEEVEYQDADMPKEFKRKPPPIHTGEWPPKPPFPSQPC